MTDGICSTRIYTLKQFMALTGMNRAAMRTARRAGLPVHYAGRAAFIVGGEFLRWAQSLPTESPTVSTRALN